MQQRQAMWGVVERMLVLTGIGGWKDGGGVSQRAVQ